MLTMTRNTPHMIACLLAASAAGALAGPTTMVDINGGNGPTQAGWLAYDPANPVTYTDALGTGRDMVVDVTLAGALRDRDRGAAITGTYAALSDLLRDFYGARENGNSITLTLTLDPGNYSFKSYHHDGELGSNNMQEVEITRLGSNQVQTSVMKSGAAPATIVTFQDSFILTASSQVEFRIRKTTLASNNGEFGFNGFELELTDPGFGVDFGTGTQDVASTFNAFSSPGSGDAGIGGTSTRTFSTDYAVGGTLTVSAKSETSNNLDFCDRGDVTGSLVGDVIEDQIKNQVGGVELTLTDLAAGTYLMTTWHHDASGGAAGNLIDILVSDALSSNRLVTDDLLTTGGFAPSAIASATFEIVSDGVNPIVILFDDANAAGNSDRETALNGFQLVLVPEPATAAMLALGIPGALARRRRCGGKH